MFSVLNINKPGGMTSRDVVDRVERVARCKAGHAGTLDPLATGVLLVCLGQATRLIEYAHQLRKTYAATFLLGRRSETDDVERDVEVVADAPVPTSAAVASAIPQFVGVISQRPPRYSAVKVAGRRAYDLARRGVDFEPAPKDVVIHDIQIVRYDYPELVLTVQCGSGVYIRSLGRDLGAALGTTAVMSSLVRFEIGSFSLSESLDLNELERNWKGNLHPPSRLTQGLPAIIVTAHELIELQHGRTIGTAGRLGPHLTAGAKIAALDAAKNLVAILRLRAEDVLSPVRNFTQPR